MEKQETGTKKEKLILTKIAGDRVQVMHWREQEDDFVEVYNVPKTNFILTMQDGTTFRPIFMTKQGATVGDFAGKRVYSSPAAYWLGEIEKILIKYESESGLELFKKAFEEIAYEENTSVPETALRDIAEIIGYCKEAIEDTLAANKMLAECELRSDQQLIGRQSNRNSNILSTLDSVRRSEVAE